MTRRQTRSGAGHGVQPGRPAIRGRRCGLDERQPCRVLGRHEAACGNLLSSAGPGRDAWPMLWTCSDRDLDRWASEDLKRWREHDAPAFTRRADYMRQAARPRAGERPWDEREEPAVEAPAVAPAPVAPVGDEDLDARREIDARRAERAAGRQARRERLAALAVPATAVTVPAAGQVIPAGIALRRPEVDGARLLEQVGLYLLDYASFPTPGGRRGRSRCGRPMRQARDADRS